MYILLMITPNSNKLALGMACNLSPAIRSLLAYAIGKAVSRSKCNKVKFIRPASFEVNSVFRKEAFCWAFPVELFSGTCVKFSSNIIERLLREDGKIRALWQILTQQAIGIFALSTLPRAVRMSEVNLDASVFSQFRLLRHSAALVISECDVTGLAPLM